MRLESRVYRQVQRRYVLYYSLVKAELVARRKSWAFCPCRCEDEDWCEVVRAHSSLVYCTWLLDPEHHTSCHLDLPYQYVLLRRPFFSFFSYEFAITRRVILRLSGHRATKTRASLTIRKTYLMLVGQNGSIVLLHIIV